MCVDFLDVFKEISLPSISQEVHSIKMHRGRHKPAHKADFSASLEWQIRVFEGKSGCEVKFCRKQQRVLITDRSQLAAGLNERC